MNTSGRLHFIYIVGILVAIIILILTARLADNADVVGYISFALTLSSILLALVAIVYSFVSNSSFAQHIGTLYQASNEVRESANRLGQIAGGLESEICTVSDKVAETHTIVSGLSNPNNNTKQPEDDGGCNLDALFARSSNAGRATMYAASVAFTTKKPFEGQSLFKLLGEGNEDYYWGWLMALDAAGIMDIKVTDGAWVVNNIDQQVLEQIQAFASDAPGDDDEYSWSTTKIKDIDDYFSS